MDLLLQIGGSLIAILLLTWLAHRLGLGGDARIRSEAQARELAGELVHDFDPVAIVIDSDGRSALLRGADDRLVLIRMHGAHPVIRLLGPSARADLWDGDRSPALSISTGERAFGATALATDDARVWKDAIDALSAAHHA